MRTLNRIRRRSLPAVVTVTLAVLSLPMTAAQFLEPDVEVLASHQAEAPGDSFGWVGERIGDLNGDGAAEYIITAPFSSAGGAVSGKVYVFSGADGSLITTRVGDPFDTLGWGATGGGDFNADGVPDYAVGGPAVFGGGNGRVIMISGADHTVLHDIVSPVRDVLGYDINPAGDVNGDGYDDLIAGALLSSAAGPATGSVTVFSGLDGSAIWTTDGRAALDFFGSSVSGLCDLNGDGVPEQVAAGYGAGTLRTGQAYLLDGSDGSILRELRPNGTAGFFGDFFAHNAGDVNADGLCDIYVGDYGDAQGGRGYVFSGAEDDRLRLFTANEPDDGLGMGRGAGDVDGDGHDDLIIGAFNASAGAPQGGQAYIFSGKNGQLRRTFTGTMALAQLGFDVVTLEDVNGDGITDFLLTGSDVAYVVAGIELDANGDN